MKILFLARQLSMGGAERQLVTLANELGGRGIETIVAAFYGGGACLADLDRKTVRFVDLKKNSVRDVVGFQARFARLLRSERPDVVHGYGRTANLASLLTRVVAPKAKLIWGVRDSLRDLSDYGLTARACSALVSATKRMPHAVIANSQAAVRVLRERGYSASRVYCVPNGFSPTRFYPDRASGAALRQAWGVSPTETLIGVVGRIEPAKDQLTFVRACGILARKYPKLRFVCVGRGWGTAQYLRSVQRAAEAASVSERMIWAEPEPNPRAIFNALDVVCSSSQSEGFPNVVGEAMACGRPLVVTEAGDSPLIVDDCWPVVRAKDPESLAGAVAQLLNADDIQARCEHGRRRMQDQFSVGRLADRTLDVIDGLRATQESLLGDFAASDRK